MNLKFRVTGMTCAACSARVEKVTRQVPGVEKAEVNLLAGTMSVEAKNAEAAEQIVEAVSSAGYGASIVGKEAQTDKPMDTGLKEIKTRILGSLACLTFLMYFTMGHMVGLPVPHWYHGAENALVAALIQFLLTIPPICLNRSYYTKGFKALRNRAPNMDSLIAVGSGAALLYGIAALLRMAYAMGHGDWDTVLHYRENLYFESAAMIVTLITVGKFLEARAKGKTGDAIRQLMDLKPKTAIICKDGNEVTVAVDAVNVGDVVIVRSGSGIPVDGTVVAGRGSVDQSALTGESVPVEKGKGDQVSAATINTEGYLEVRADRVGEDTTLSKIIHMVEEAGGSKAPIARLADKIAGIFVPAVIVIALVAFAVWMTAGKGLEFSLSIGISVLVISCPCALGLATPVAIMVGTGRAARMGVLFKNAEALENLHKIDTVVLDKTGTLTAGKPAVTDIIAHKVTAEELLTVAASLEALSEHPFAKAIMERSKNIELLQTQDFKTLPGRGVCGKIGNSVYYGGNRRLMEEINVPVPEFPELAEEGKTPLYFADEDKNYLGAIAAADVLKDDSAEAVKEMRRHHLDVVMLTGDNERTAMAVAKKAGITHVISEVLPADKAEEVRKLRSQGRNVLMVGDGINDAPALATADLGMAIGAGTDIAMESAQIVLMNSSLKGVSDAVSLSKATIRNIRQNLFWAFFYNCLGIPIAAGVLYPAFQIQLSPMLGAAAMSLSSFFVVTNALRLRLLKIKPRETLITKNTIQEETEMEIIIHVEGMMCPHCKARVESVCKAAAGVVDAVVDLQAKQVTVKGNADVNVLKKAIIEAGYEVV